MLGGPAVARVQYNPFVTQKGNSTIHIYSSVQTAGHLYFTMIII